MMIRELRSTAGMTPREFAAHFGIPVSTLRKWEQGESTPPAYVITLLARSLPGTHRELRKLKGRGGDVFFYNKSEGKVADARGNEILVREDLDQVKEQNLSIYLDDLFRGFYDLQASFDRDCRMDREEDILWTE